jgi:hypothetical protein
VEASSASFSSLGASSIAAFAPAGAGAGAAPSNPGARALPTLVVLLLRERWRRTEKQMGAIGAVSIGALICGFAWLAAEAWRNFPGAGDDSIPQVIRPAWLCWLIAGALTGRDLFWHPALHKYRALGLSARRAYVLGIPLGFLSAPLLALAFVVGARAYEHWIGGAGRLALLAIAFILASQTANLGVSIIRTLLLRAEAIPAWLATLGACMVLGTVAAGIRPYLGMTPSSWSAIDLTAAAMGGREWPVLPSVLVLALLTLVDATMYAANVRSGLRGDGALPAAWTAPLQRRRIFRVTGGASALESIALLGWLRNRASMLLFVWGLGYGFGYVFVTRPESPVGILAFLWMVSLFHSYLRGNLFGVDRRSAWWYFAIPQGVRGGLAAKNRSLSLIQYVMLAGVLVACVAGGRPAFRQAGTLVMLVSCAVTMTTVGEIVGSYTSVRWPDPIERASQYSGGTALGALLVPLALTIAATLLAVLMSVSQARLPAATAAVLLLGIALGFKALQAVHERTILAGVITDHAEDMRKQLAAFKT